MFKGLKGQEHMEVEFKIHHDESRNAKELCELI